MCTVCAYAEIIEYKVLFLNKARELEATVSELYKESLLQKLSKPS